MGGSGKTRLLCPVGGCATEGPLRRGIELVWVAEAGLGPRRRTGPGEGSAGQLVTV